MNFFKWGTLPTFVNIQILRVLNFIIIRLFLFFVIILFCVIVLQELYYPDDGHTITIRKTN